MSLEGANLGSYTKYFSILESESKVFFLNESNSLMRIVLDPKNEPGKQLSPTVTDYHQTHFCHKNHSATACSGCQDARGHRAPREGPLSTGARQGWGRLPRIPTGHQEVPRARAAPLTSQGPADEPLAPEGGPSPLPCSAGHWLGLPLALVSLSPPQVVTSFSLPAAKAGTSGQGTCPGVTAALPLEHPKDSVRWRKG